VCVLVNARAFILRLAFSFAVLAVVLVFVDVAETWRELAGLDPLFLLLGLACLLSTRVLVAFKWWLLLGGRTAAIRYAVVQRAIFLADYQTLLFPNTLAVDAMRLVLLRHHPRGMTYMASTIIADRVVNVQVAAAMALFGMLLLASQPMGASLDQGIILIVVGTSVALLAAGTALLSRRLFALAMLVLERVLAHGPLRRPGLAVAAKGRSLHESMTTLLAHRETLAKAVSISVLVVLMRIATVYCMFAAVGTLLGLLPLLAIYPIIMLFVLLPISILGIGVQDGAFVFFFGSLGVAASVSLAASIGHYATIVSCSLCCGMIAALVGPPMPKAAHGPRTP
jgi:uncharacterized protein (TIRG00374 family)